MKKNQETDVEVKDYFSRGLHKERITKSYKLMFSHILKWNTSFRFLNEMGQIVQIPVELWILMNTVNIFNCGCITNYMPD